MAYFKPAPLKKVLQTALANNGPQPPTTPVVLNAVNTTPKSKGKTKEKKVKKDTRILMTFEELQAQVALGTLNSKGSNTLISKIVKDAIDPRVVMWGARNSNSTIRVAAAKNPYLPTGMALRMVIMDPASTVRNAARALLESRPKELSGILEMCGTYPQLSMVLDDKKPTKSAKSAKGKSFSLPRESVRHVW